MIQITRKPTRKLNSEINTVPYIDVMLVLLVIFMMTTPIINHGIDVDLPKSAGGEPTGDSNEEQLSTVVTIDKEGKYYISSIDIDSSDNEQTTLEGVRQKIIARIIEYPAMKIFIGADEKVDYGRVVSLMSDLQESGIDNVGLLTETINRP